MEEIIDNLYLGSAIEVQLINFKIKKGFTACLSIGKEFSISNIQNINFKSHDDIILPNLNLLGINHKIFSIADMSSNTISKLLPEVISIINDNINKGKVYVHCFAGISRSPSIVFAYMLSKGFDPIEAINIMINKRNIIYPYNNFIYEILSYFKINSIDLVMEKINKSINNISNIK